MMNFSMCGKTGHYSLGGERGIFKTIFARVLTRNNFCKFMIILVKLEGWQLFECVQLTCPSGTELRCDVFS